MDAIDLAKGKDSGDKDGQNGRDDKSIEIKKLVEDRVKSGRKKHDHELPDCDRPDYFLFDIDKLGNSELLHT